MIVGCNSSNIDLELGNDQSSNRTYSVTYTLNEGTFTVEPQLDINDQILPYQLPLPTKEGYVFEGWYDNQSFRGQPITILNERINSDLRLYAKWREDLITLRLEIIREPFDLVGWDWIHNYAVLDNLNRLQLITNSHYQFFLDFGEIIIDIEDFLNPSEKIILRDLSYENLIIVTSENRVLTYGRNEYGQLGDGSYESDFDKLIDITSSFGFDQDEYPIKVEFYLNKVGLMTNNGRIFLWGGTPFFNTFGNYSNIPIDVTLEFEYSNSNEKIIDFTIGEQHVFITNFKNVFAWGRPSNGGLGLSRPDMVQSGEVPFNASEIYDVLKFDLDEDIVIVELSNGLGALFTS
jgi:uncharacterized repeat protein (TIGR02543 family)